jgi:uncharacterized membrane protein YhaH (DUF805 family)
VKVLAKFCKKCGKKIDDDAVFCDNCGTKVASGGSLPAPSALFYNSNGQSLGPDYATEDEALSWWNCRGRLNRQRFIFRYLILMAITVVVGIILFGVTSLLGTNVVMSGHNEDTVIGVIVILLLCVLFFFLPLTVLSIFISIKRGHDLNIPGWVVVIISLLGASFFLSIYLAVAEGNDGTNQYGENPLKYAGSI